MGPRTGLQRGPVERARRLLDAVSTPFSIQKRDIPELGGRRRACLRHPDLPRCFWLRFEPTQ
eukprot:8461012-Pyramimonas_sp.AAC.1